MSLPTYIGRILGLDYGVVYQSVDYESEVSSLGFNLGVDESKLLQHCNIYPRLDSVNSAFNHNIRDNVLVFTQQLS